MQKIWENIRFWFVKLIREKSMTNKLTIAILGGFFLSIILQMFYIVIVPEARGILSFQLLNFLNINGLVLETLGGSGLKYTLNFEIWRYVSSTFLHVNLVHLVLNLFALNILGNFIERFYGEKELLIIFILGGVGGSIASDIAGFANVMMLGGNISGITVGASGAIFALLGIMLGQSFRTRRYGMELPIDRNQLYYIIGLNLLFGFLIPGINNAAHIGGLITGFILAFFLQSQNSFIMDNFAKIKFNTLFYLTIGITILSAIFWVGNLFLNVL